MNNETLGPAPLNVPDDEQAPDWPAYDCDVTFLVPDWPAADCKEILLAPDWPVVDNCDVTFQED